MAKAQKARKPIPKKMLKGTHDVSKKSKLFAADLEHFAKTLDKVSKDVGRGQRYVWPYCPPPETGPLTSVKPIPPPMIKAAKAMEKRWVDIGKTLKRLVMAYTSLNQPGGDDQRVIFPYCPPPK